VMLPQWRNAGSFRHKALRRPKADCLTRMHKDWRE
jgi:hypothetical protein